MSSSQGFSPKDLTADLLAGLVVFLVALPLCLGVALASDAPLFSGIISGIVGGIVVGLLSGSQTSVSGPAAGLTAIVAAQIATLGSFEAFLAAVVLAGVLQLVLGALRAGFIAAFFPSSVIKGLLAAIGVILILKQIPHVIGHDSDSIADMNFSQMDGDNTITALFSAFFDVHYGAAIVGLSSILLLVLWDKIAFLKKSPIPAPLVVVLMGMGLARLFQGSGLGIDATHLVQVPVASSPAEVLTFFQSPDWSSLGSSAVYGAALTIAIVATLETLLNLEAVDKIDPLNRYSPQNRELVAQGAGNIVAGLLGGIPMTSVIVRSSVNIDAGNKTRISTIFHGILILVSVVFAASLLNTIPLASLAAILLMTGLKLASPKLFKQMSRAGKFTFLPFVVTVVAIVLTDLLTGILIGLAVSVMFILYSNFQRPLRPIVERRIGGDVLRILLANQVSFLNRAALTHAFYSVERGGHVLFDARQTEYIDPDIVDLLSDFRDTEGPARGVQVSFLGFREHYSQLSDEIRFVDYSTKEVQRDLSPDGVLALLMEGNERFRSGRVVARDLVHHTDTPDQGAYPLAVTLSGIDGSVPVEQIFDVGMGDILSERVAGMIASPEVLGGIEYGVAVAGAKLVVIMGHSGSTPVAAALDEIAGQGSSRGIERYAHLKNLLIEIRRAFDLEGEIPPSGTPERALLVDRLTRKVVRRTLRQVKTEAPGVARLVAEGKVRVVGAFYDAKDGSVLFFDEDGAELARPAE